MNEEARRDSDGAIPCQRTAAGLCTSADNLCHNRERNAGARAHLSKYIRQVSEQAKDKLLRLQRACDNRAQQGLSRDWPCALRPIQ